MLELFDDMQMLLFSSLPFLMRSSIECLLVPRLSLGSTVVPLRHSDPSFHLLPSRVCLFVCSCV